MGIRRSLVILMALALAAVIAPSAAEDPACATTPMLFGPPVRLGVGSGYEPGIEIDSAGTIFVTAHKYSLVEEETRDAGGQARTASFLWRSTDGGATFHDLQGLAGATRFTWALEGDLAVDARDRLYFVDTWGADLHTYRFSDHGDTLDFVRPGIPTPELDDRPWITAHHDGYVYYMSNSVNEGTGRLVIHRSTDGGLTYDPVGFSLPQSWWGFLDADPNSDYVYAVVNDGDVLTGDTKNLYAWVSSDRGATWAKHHIGSYDLGWNVTSDHDDAYPTVAVSPVDGSVYALWTDDGRRIKLARSTDRGQTWDVSDVTPFSGRFSYPWLATGPAGEIGISFEAEPTGKGRFVYGMVLRQDARCIRADGTVCEGYAGSFARARKLTVPTQPDFFQNEFDPAGRLNVVFKGNNNEILYAKQSAGPTLAGTTPCGISGSI